MILPLAADGTVLPFLVSCQHGTLLSYFQKATSVPILRREINPLREGATAVTAQSDVPIVHPLQARELNVRAIPPPHKSNRPAITLCTLHAVRQERSAVQESGLAERVRFASVHEAPDGGEHSFQFPATPHPQERIRGFVHQPGT